MAQRRAKPAAGGPVDDDEVATAGRSARKRRAILDAAREAFLAKGYAGTSMDDVASSAAVSKQTVYKHFADKRRLFATVVIAEIDTTEAITHDVVEALGSSDDLEGDLRRFARQHVVDVTQPHLLRLRRMIIAEAEQFPDLAATWYARGPERAHAALARQLDTLTRRGVLRTRDPSLAAQQLNWLILAIPLHKALFQGGDTSFSRRELHRYADEGVRVFLAAHAVG